MPSAKRSSKRKPCPGNSNLFSIFLNFRAAEDTFLEAEEVFLLADAVFLLADAILCSDFEFPGQGFRFEGRFAEGIVHRLIAP